MKVSYIHVEDFKYYTSFDLETNREELIKNVFGNAYEIEMVSVSLDDYAHFKDKTIAKLEELLKHHPIPESSLPIYRDRFEDKKVYVFRDVLGKRLKLFQGGNDALISFLVKILTMLDYAINNNQKIRISKYETGIEFIMARKQYLANNKLIS